VADATPRSTISLRTLLPEPFRGRLVHLQQRLTFDGVHPMLVARVQLGQGHAKSLRQQLHRVLEADLLVQLEKFEHVATDAAAKTMKESLVAIDVERRRLLRMERTETFEGRAHLLQRHVVLHNRYDVGMTSHIVDEGLRKKCHVN
jgi:hypothetical protein